MQVNLLIFGQLTDITGDSSLIVNDIADTDSLTREMTKRFPSLSGAKFIVAVNKEVISGNTILQNNSTVALLPPFSGG